MSLLQELSRHSPTAPVFNNLGMAQFMRDDMSGAIRNLRNAVRLSPKESLYHYNLGLALRAIGNLGRAIEELERALSLMPGNHRAVTDLAYTMRMDGRSEEAIVLLGRYTKQKNPSHGSGLAGALSSAGRFEEAVAAAQASVKLFPDDASSYRELSGALFELGLTAEAEAAIRTAVELDPGDDGVWISLGNVHLVAGRFQDAELAYRRSLQITPSPNGFDSLASLLMNLGQLKESEAMYLKTTAIYPGRISTYYGLGVLYATQGRSVEAEKMLRQAIGIDPKHPYPQHGLGVLLATTGRLKEAEPYFRRALEIDPSPENHETLARVLMGTGPLRGCRAGFTRRLEPMARRCQSAQRTGLEPGRAGRQTRRCARLRAARGPSFAEGWRRPGHARMGPLQAGRI